MFFGEKGRRQCRREAGKDGTASNLAHSVPHCLTWLICYFHLNLLTTLTYSLLAPKDLYRGYTNILSQYFVMMMYYPNFGFIIVAFLFLKSSCVIMIVS